MSIGLGTTQLPWLSMLMGGSIIGAGAVLVLREHPTVVRWVALATALVGVVLCIPLMCGFDTSTYQMQFLEQHAWIPTYGIRYALGVDGVSLPLVVLTVYTTLLIVLAAWRSVRQHVAEYMAAFLLLQAMTIGIFCALDAVLFYVFWEGVLIPMYLCIGIWGGHNRSYAAIKFFLYTFFGSALLLIALLYLGMKAGTFSIASFYPLPLGYWEQLLIFLGFLLAFAIKVPMWPVHTWLPDAHTEAPTGGSVILAALMLKIGGYGLLRFSLPITPDASVALAPMMIGLSLVAIIYIGLVALAQTDMKRLIAYSSVAHMGFVTLGMFVIYSIVRHTTQLQDADIVLEGAMVQMISHAFGAGALFLGFGMLYERMHTRKIADFGGVAQSMPFFAAFFLIFCMTNVGLPGTSGFVGEFMIIVGVMRGNFWLALCAASTLIIAAAYTLWMFKRVFYGPIAHHRVSELSDITALEGTVLGLLVVAVFALGLYPRPLIKVVDASVHHVLQLSTRSKLVKKRGQQGLLTAAHETSVTDSGIVL